MLYSTCSLPLVRRPRPRNVPYSFFLLLAFLTRLKPRDVVVVVVLLKSVLSVCELRVAKHFADVVACGCGWAIKFYEAVKSKLWKLREMSLVCVNLYRPPTQAHTHTRKIRAYILIIITLIKPKCDFFRIDGLRAALDEFIMIRNVCFPRRRSISPRKPWKIHVHENDGTASNQNVRARAHTHTYTLAQLYAIVPLKSNLFKLESAFNAWTLSYHDMYHLCPSKKNPSFFFFVFASHFKLSKQFPKSTLNSYMQSHSSHFL